MNSLLNGDDDLDDARPIRRDREITLGTTVVLGIFFALAALCAVFFGFGYSVGRRSAPAAVGSASLESANSTPFNSFKPAPGSPLGLAPAAKPAPLPTVTVPMNTPASAVEAAPRPVRATPADFDPPPAAPAPEPIKPVRPATLLTAPATAAPAPTAIAGPAAPGQFMVQVAAVSHQEDADTLVSSLAHHGYSVAIHHEAQDKLLHVQIGPFSTRKDADSMRQRILADGFNAIVK